MHGVLNVAQLQPASASAGVMHLFLLSCARSHNMFRASFAAQGNKKRSDHREHMIVHLGNPYMELGRYNNLEMLNMFERNPEAFRRHRSRQKKKQYFHKFGWKQRSPAGQRGSEGQFGQFVRKWGGRAKSGGETAINLRSILGETAINLGGKLGESLIPSQIRSLIAPSACGETAINLWGALGAGNLRGNCGETAINLGGNSIWAEF